MGPPATSLRQPPPACSCSCTMLWGQLRWPAPVLMRRWAELTGWTAVEAKGLPLRGCFPQMLDDRPHWTACRPESRFMPPVLSSVPVAGVPNCLTQPVHPCACSCIRSRCLRPRQPRLRLQRRGCVLCSRAQSRLERLQRPQLQQARLKQGRGRRPCWHSWPLQRQIRSACCSLQR